MTKDEFGLYGYFYSLIWIFSLILNFGFFLAQTKLYHDYDKEGKKNLIFTINVSLCVLLFLTLFPIYFFGLDYYFIKLLFTHSINYEAYRWFLLLGVVVAVFSFMYTNYFITSENIKRLQIFNFLKLVFVNSIVIYALSAKSPDSVKIRLEYSYIVELFIVLLFTPFYISNMHPKFDFTILKKSFKIGMPSMLISIVSLVYNFSDKYILEKYGTFSDLAVYNLGFTIASIIGVVYASFQSVYLPFFYKEKDFTINLKKTKEIAKKMAGIFSLLGIAIWIGVYFMLKLNILDVKYHEIIYILPILLISQNFQSMSQLFTNYIVYFEVVYVGTVIVFLMSILNVVSNMLLIPHYNFYGASISALIISICSLFMYYQFTIRKARKAKLLNE